MEHIKAYKVSTKLNKSDKIYTNENKKKVKKMCNM